MHIPEPLQRYGRQVLFMALIAAYPFLILCTTTLVSILAGNGTGIAALVASTVLSFPLFLKGMDKYAHLLDT